MANKQNSEAKYPALTLPKHTHTRTLTQASAY